MISFQPESWTVGDLFVSQKGAKSASITCRGEAPKFRFATPENPISSPYGASSFDAGTRLSIDFVLTKDLQDFCEALDSWAKTTLQENSEILFSKKHSQETIEQMYQSVIKKHAKGSTTYPNTVRCKFNSTGARQIRFWDEQHKPIEQPDLKHHNVVPLVEIRSFWFANNSCGLTLDIIDLMCLQTAEKKCPF